MVTTKATVLPATTVQDMTLAVLGEEPLEELPLVAANDVNVWSRDDLLCPGTCSAAKSCS